MAVGHTQGRLAGIARLVLVGLTVVACAVSPGPPPVASVTPIPTRTAIPTAVPTPTPGQAAQPSTSPRATDPPTGTERPTSSPTMPIPSNRWIGGPILIERQATWAVRLVNLGGGSALVVYQTHDGWYTRRTSDGGRTWEPPIERPLGADLGGNASDVDMAWTEEGRVMYAHSADAGDGFEPSIAMSRRVDNRYLEPWVEFLARDEQGLVVVAWRDYLAEELVLRASMDGGARFGDTRPLSVSSSEDAAWALADGALYVAHYVGSRLRVISSLDAGVTWSAPVELWTTANDACGSAVTAAGNEAYVVTTPLARGSVGRFEAYRTSDRGQVWSGPISLTSGDGFACGPELSMSGGVVRFVYTWHQHNVGTPGQVRYRESTNGVDWLSDDPLPIAPGFDADARDVAVLGENLVVLYQVRAPEGRTSVYVQLGVP